MKFRISETSKEPEWTIGSMIGTDYFWDGSPVNQAFMVGVCLVQLCTVAQGINEGKDLDETILPDMQKVFAEPVYQSFLEMLWTQEEYYKNKPAGAPVERG